MKKSKDLDFFRWLIPLCIYFAIMAAILIPYRNQVYSREVKAKETEMTLAMEQELDVLDLRIENVTSSLMASSQAMSFFDINYDYNQVMTLLKGIVNTTDVTSAFVCDLSGNGYDYQGKEIAIEEEGFFEEVSSEYSRSGMGIVLPENAESLQNIEVLVVAHVDFENDQPGYLIAILPVFPISDSILPEKYPAEKVGFVTMNGTVLASTINEEKPGLRSRSFWDNIPQGLSKDTVKLTISQKNTYMSDVKGYGYVIVVPMKEANGGAVALITTAQMNTMIRKEMAMANRMLILVLVASIVLFLMIITANILSDKIKFRMKEKRLSQIEIDPVTGLLTEYSAFKEIEKYVQDPLSERALLFIIGVEGFDLKDDPEKVKADERRKVFARALSSAFRSTDIVGRIGDDRFLVFMKDIVEDKDIRTQSDEMQMLLHDLELREMDVTIKPHAGASVYPENGKTARGLIEAAQAALERTMEAGVGRLSF